MFTLKCGKCQSNSQSDRPIKVCPVCDTPNPNFVAPAADPNAGGGQSTTAPSGPGPESAQPPAPIPAAVASAVVKATETTATFETKAGEAVSFPAVQTSAAPATSSAPAAAGDLATSIENNAAKALDDVDEIATILTKSFAGTPVAAIFALLGPAAGIGAAVLHQHLQHVGFDLSKLKTLPPIA